MIGYWAFYPWILCQVLLDTLQSCFRTTHGLDENLFPSHAIAFFVNYNCCNASQSISGSLLDGLQWNLVPIGTDSLKKPPIFR